jgi:hypothetical protein
MFQKKPFMKPKPKADLSEPDSLDAKPKFKMPMHEEAEEPEVEASEDYGAKLMADIDAAGEEHGLDAQTTRKVAASIFSAAAKCLAGEQEPVESYDAGGESLEGEEE